MQAPEPPQKFDDAIAWEIVDGDIPARIGEDWRGRFGEYIAGIGDPILKQSCQWFMEHLESGDMSDLEGKWLQFFDAKGVPPKEVSRILYTAVKHLLDADIIEEAPDEDSPDDVVDMEQDEERICRGETRLLPDDAAALDAAIERYRAEIAAGKEVARRTVQLTLLERVRDGQSTAWPDIYAAIRSTLDAQKVSEAAGREMYLDAASLNIGRNIIRKESAE